MKSVNLGHTSRFSAILNSLNNCLKAHEPQREIILLGYRFSFVQQLIPETDEHGHALKFYPQVLYKGNKKLHKFSSGPFCRFSITADNCAGVYLLVSDDEILYIGETCNLNQRFNNRSYGSYGFITPAACYQGGQSTNCKINMLVLQHFEMKQPLMLYFLQTTAHKRIERELLHLYKTPFNSKA